MDEQQDDVASTSTAKQDITNLPNLHDMLSSWLGINLPHLPPLPQTIKNADKALGRMILSGGENISSRWERNTSIRRVKTAAEENAMKAAAKIFAKQMAQGSPELERTIEFTFGDSILKQKNRENIAKLTYVDLSEDVSATDAATDISDDWLNAYSDIAGNKSDEDIQQLWGKILAGEIRQPGSFRLKSLLSLSAVDSSDAAAINSALAKTVNSSFLFRSSSEEDLNPFMNMESLDVLIVGGGMLANNYKLVKDIPVFFNIANNLILCVSPDDRALSIPMYKLTRFGEDLVKISKYQQIDETYIQAFIAHLKKSGLKVSRSVSVIQDDKQIYYGPLLDC